MIDPQAPAPVFENGARVKVRRLQGEFTVLSSRMIGKVRRYRLDAVPDTGAILAGTEAFGDDMELLPAPEPAPELALLPDPPAASSPPQELALASPDAAAPAAERSAAAAVCSPAPGITLSRDPDDFPARDAWEIPPGAVGGELDEYSAGAQVDHTHDPEDREIEEFREAFGQPKPPPVSSRTKELRYYPAVAMSYSQLKNILYSAHFKGMEKGPYAELDNDTPVAVAATYEANGAAVWIVTVRDSGEVREAQLEVFFPADRVQAGPGCNAMAIEHAVLLALRKIPIRRNDLEILLLQVEK